MQPRERMYVVARCGLIVAVVAIVAIVLAGARGVAQPPPIVIELDDVPAPARKAIERQSGGRPILAVTTRAGHGGELVYEAIVAGVDENVELAVDGSGKTVGRFIIPHAPGLDGR